MKTPHLFQILSTANPLPPPPPTHTPPHHLQRPTATVLSIFLFLWLNGWSRHIWCDILHNEIMTTWIYTCCALVHEYQKDLDVYFMQNGVKVTEVRHIMRFLLVLWFGITQTNTNTHSTFQDQETDTPI